MASGVKRNFLFAQLLNLVHHFHNSQMGEMFPSKDPEGQLIDSNVTELTKGLEKEERIALETDGAT